MCDNNTLTAILNQITEKAKSQLSDSFISLTLYGSYARGDYTAESDINILILTSLDPERIKSVASSFLEFLLGIDLEYDVVTSVIFMDYRVFSEYRSVYPLFKIIQTEGVV